MPSKPRAAAPPPQEQERTEFAPETLRVAADALQEKAMTSGDVSIMVSVELRALAAHLRTLSGQGGA